MVPHLVRKRWKSSEEDPFQMKLFTDKHFSYIMRSKAGEWKSASAGTYELIDQNTYRETHLHTTNRQYTGWVIDWNYEVRGDSLIFEGPTRIRDSKGSRPAEADQWLNAPLKEIRVRAE